jgi:hypothetical protein
MDFYRVMLQRIPEDKKATALCMLQLVLSISGTYKTTLAEFSLIVELPEEEDLALTVPGLAPLDELQRCKIMERRVKTVCGGLLEIQDGLPDYMFDKISSYRANLISDISENDIKVLASRVQFLHQTAKEFVELPENSDVLGGNSAKQNAIIGYERIMKLYTYLLRRNDPK